MSQSWLVASLRLIGRCAQFNVKLLHFSVPPIDVKYLCSPEWKNVFFLFFVFFCKPESKLAATYNHLDCIIIEFGLKFDQNSQNVKGCGILEYIVVTEYVAALESVAAI